MRQKMIALIATLDTKGEEASYLLKRIEDMGAKAISIDGGISGEPYFKPDIDRESVARRAGTTFDDIRKIKEEGVAIEKMAYGIGNILKAVSYTHLTLPTKA